ncbi:MAG TPA: sigma-70 family RNA polymerase sigma factor [Verrucomicrobiae bacterium]|nr:sigma-70 family RNA polymerase sigma factor [Verrucomicrobiae bacterium]
MNEPNDLALLREYATSNSETAFEELISRRVDFVYSAALRQTRNPHLAEEITQAVFILLAQKAEKIPDKTILTGWLFKTARFTALAQIRTETKRARQQKEFQMESEVQSTATDELWNQMSPLLDEALAALGENDRQAVLLRFFENKSLAEVGEFLGIGEDTARKRISRALEKLHHYFNRRGVSSTTAIIAGAISTNSVHAAPIGLAKAISTMAVVKGATASTSTLTLIKGALELMAWTKTKTAIVAGVVVLLISGMATTTILYIENSPQKIAEETQTTYAALTSYSDTCIGTASSGSYDTQTSCTIKLQRPKQYRVEWSQTSESSETKGIVWSDGNVNYLISDKAEKFSSASPQKVNNTQQAFAFANEISGSLASTVPCVFFNLNYGNTLAVFPLKDADTRRLPDEKIDGVDCFVLVNVLDAAKVFARAKLLKSSSLEIENENTGTNTTTIWIGKTDYLIRQVRSVTAGSSTIVKWTDDMLKRRLQYLNKPITPENLANLRVEMEQAQEQANKTDFVFTEKHQNIVVNQQYSPVDFIR